MDIAGEGVVVVKDASVVPCIPGKWRPRTKFFCATLWFTSLFNVAASVFALRTSLVYPHYMISHVILNDSLRFHVSVVWSLAAFVCFCVEVAITRDWWRRAKAGTIGPKNAVGKQRAPPGGPSSSDSEMGGIDCGVDRTGEDEGHDVAATVSWYGALGMLGMAACCAGWVGTLIWDIDEYVCVHAVMGALYGGGFMFRAAVHVWFIDPHRNRLGLPADPGLLYLRQVALFLSDYL